MISYILPVNKFGIIPRTSFGLIGILGAPFLHGGWAHLISNTIGILTFAPIFIFIEGKNAIEKLIMLTLITGTFTWLLARPAIHIGASGVVFALYGYLISLGFFKKKFLYILLSIFLFTSYGYIMFGVLPIQPGISWESHLLGFIAGLLLARYK